MTHQLDRPSFVTRHHEKNWHVYPTSHKTLSIAPFLRLRLEQPVVTNMAFKRFKLLIFLYFYVSGYESLSFNDSTNTHMRKLACCHLTKCLPYQGSSAHPSSTVKPIFPMFWPLGPNKIKHLTLPEFLVMAILFLLSVGCWRRRKINPVCRLSVTQRDGLEPVAGRGIAFANGGSVKSRRMGQI